MFVNLGCRLFGKVNSRSCNDFVSCVEAVWGMERSQLHDPLVLTVLQPLTFSTLAWMSKSSDSGSPIMKPSSLLPLLALLLASETAMTILHPDPASAILPDV